MSKTAGYVLLTVGLILGPGYFIYTRFYTGREITELPLEFHPDTAGRPRAIANLDLLPVMGPLTLIVNFTAAHGSTLSPPNTPRNHYRVRILLNGDTLLTRTFTLRAKRVEATPAEVFKQALPVLEIAAPGRYQLELVQEGASEMEIKQASVQVRTGVHHVNREAVATGIGLLVVGLAVILVAL